ncbi:MAG: DUF3307 domain-containing protein [Pseudomonadota bacterium]
MPFTSVFSALSDLQFVFALLVLFQLKHLVGDYVCQTRWMVSGKSKSGFGFIGPLSVHALIHAGLTLMIVVIVDRSLWYLAAFDFAIHFVLDRIKSSPRLLGRFTDMSRRSFWVPFGIDQFAHHLTHYAIIWWIVAHRV